MPPFDATTQRYLDLLGRLRQAVIATDATGTIIEWNPAAEELYGWPAQEVLGSNVLDVTPMELSRAQGTEIMQALAKGEVWSGEFHVQNRAGSFFTASVTDVPLLDELRGVAGVIGVSALSQAPTRVVDVLERFAAACEGVWPQQIAFTVDVPRHATVRATEPHLIQLLSLLLIRHAEALDSGTVVEISVGTADKSPFTDFALIPASKAGALYIRIDRRERQERYSVLRSAPGFAEPTQYVSALVRMVSGLLIAGTAPNQTSAIHVFMPLEG